MVVKFTRLTHGIVIQLHLVAESCTICRVRSRGASPETFGYTLVHDVSGVNFCSRFQVSDAIPMV